MSATPIQNRPIAAAAPAQDERLARVRRVVTGTDGGSGAAISRDQLLTDVKWGVAISAPMEIVSNSEAYRKGQIDGRKYTATIIANSLGFGTWTIGGAIATALLAPVGLPGFALAVAGFAAGMLANDLWDRTFGRAIIKVLSDRLPKGPTEKFAHVVTKYFANPFHDYFWNPIKNTVMKHKVLGGVLLAGAALRFPTAAKAIGREAGVWIGGMAAAMGIEFGLVNRILPPAPSATDAGPTTAQTSAEDQKAMQILEDAYKTAIGKFAEKGATPQQADAAAQKWLVDTLVKNGASLADAQQMVKAAAEDVKAAKPAPRTPAVDTRARN